MEKRKVKQSKKVSPETEIERVGYDQQIQDLSDLIVKAAFSITKVNSRLDKIVGAISKSKSCKGM